MAGEAREPVKIAVLGAGSFVKDAYLEPLKANPHWLLVTALWSRSPDSVWALLPAVQGFSPSCRPYHGDSGLQALLASSDVDAVIVVLPPQAQGAVIQAALRAGKHVLSEKPAAATLAQAQQLLEVQGSLPQPAPMWCVAENYRSMDAFLRLRDAIGSGQLGKIATLNMAVDLAMSPGNKYFASSWRRDTTSMPGAYLTEGGVHFVAALRMAASAAGFGQAVAAAASSAGVAPDLPHPDTIQGSIWFESGASAGYSMTMAAGCMHISLRAVGTAGSAKVSRGGFGPAPGQRRSFQLVQQMHGDVEPTQLESKSSGLEEELLCFARLAHAATKAAPGISLTLTPREAGAAAATDRSDPERDATALASGGAAGEAAAPEAGRGAVAAAEKARKGLPRSASAPLVEMPSDEDAYRISCVEAARDLAVVTALLESAALGGQRVDVVQL